MPPSGRAKSTADAEGSSTSPVIRLSVTPAAAAALKAALAARAPGYAVRLFVGGGSHPQVGMSIDTPTARDDSLTVEGLPFVLDSGSRPFLDESTVDYVETAAGAGFRVTGPNAPAPPAAPPSTPAETAGPPTSAADAVRRALKNVYDPEIPMNIVDLGLIYALDVDPTGKADVRFTLTSPGCPVADLLVEEVRKAVLGVDGIRDASVEVVWEPAWSPERMSAFAKRQLGFA